MVMLHSYTGRELEGFIFMNNSPPSTNICVDDVISTGRRMLKLSLKFEYLFTFLFLQCQKSLCKYCNEISQPFPNFEGASKLILQEQLKQQEPFDVSTPISTFNNLSK